MKFINERIKTLFYILATTLLVSVLAAFYFNNLKVKATSDLVEHTQEVLRKSDEILVDILNIETSGRGFLISGNEAFLAPYTEGVSKIDNHLVELEKLTKDNENQQKRIVLLKKTVNERLVLTKNIIEAKKLNELNEVEKIKVIEIGKTLSDKIRSIIEAINAEEFDLLRQRKMDNEATNQYSSLLFLLLLFLLISIAALIAFIIKNQKIRNKELEDFSAAQKILEQDLIKYKHFFNQSTDYLCICTMDGYFELINPSLAAELGYSEDELLKNKFLDFIHPDDVEDTLKEMQNVSKGKTLLNFVNRYRKSDGSYLSLEWKANYNLVAGRIYGIGRDVTEKKRNERDLMDAKTFAEAAAAVAKVAKVKAEYSAKIAEEATVRAEDSTKKAEDSTKIAEKATKIAEEAVKSKQQFLSTMSHEIRTPMNAIIGFTKVLLKSELTAKQLEYLTAIKLSGDTLIVLINDILDLAKVDAGKMSFEHAPFNLTASLSSILHIFDIKIQEKNLTLIKEFDPKIPEIVLGDAIRLHQIIMNLMGNAVKFTAKGCIRVRTVLLNEDAESVTVQFAVADTGIGISADKMVSIFDNFQQASSETARLFGGTGLGLAIVKQLVEAQGGKVFVESKITDGSVFSFNLRFLKTDNSPELNPELMALNTDIKNIRILVVEDMKLNQLLMQTILDDFGFAHDMADNGLIAVEKLKNSVYDIILMDLQMPEMNGFEATDYIRNTLKSTVPIIALTADVTTVDVAKCTAVGMNDYISKPLDERILYTKIRNLIKTF